MPAFFTDTELAARIERVECRLVQDCALHVAQRRPEVGAFALPLAGGVAAFGGATSPLSKVVGLGFGGPLDESRLAEVEHCLARHGCAVQVEQCTLANPAIAAQLTRRGYVLVGFENVLGLRLPQGLSSVASRAPGALVISVTRCADAELPVWADVLARAFAVPDVQGVPSHESIPDDALRQIASDMAAVPGFQRYLAATEAVAGAASMRVADGVAQLCGAATLPEHRRRGVQTALLATRLREAAELGCDLAVVTVLPGSRSQQNAQRHGFELLYARAILRREAPAT